MKIIQGIYKKENNECRKTKVLIFNKDQVHTCGIDLSLLNEKEQQDVLDIQMDYELKMKKYMKAFRNFKTNYFLDSTIK